MEIFKFNIHSIQINSFDSGLYKFAVTLQLYMYEINLDRSITSSREIFPV